MGWQAHLREYRSSSRESADGALLRNNVLTCELPQPGRVKRLAYGARTRAQGLIRRSCPLLICWTVSTKMRLPAGGSPCLAT